MTDILSRIKSWRSEPLADDPQHNWDWLAGMLDEAGEEIERLTKALKTVDSRLEKNRRLSARRFIKDVLDG